MTSFSAFAPVVGEVSSLSFISDLLSFRSVGGGGFLIVYLHVRALQLPLRLAHRPLRD